MMMKNPMPELREQCRALIAKAFRACISKGALPDAPLPDFGVEIPADPSHGDLASNAAMAGAKVFRLPPRTIAAALQGELQLEGSSFSSVEIAGAGFLNFWVGRRWFSQCIGDVLAAGADYGRTDTGKGQRVIVEYVSANPTGPMHIGNARGGAVGDSLASALQWAGFDVTREYYVNDAGNQIEKFGVSLEARYLQLFQEGVEMPEGCYMGEDIIAHAKGFAAVHGDRYVGADADERKKALVEYALPLNIAGIERDLARYRIHYDSWFKESSLYTGGEAWAMVEALKGRGCTYEQDGAVWFKGSEYGADKDFVLVRANGLLTYVVPDIAYHYNKLVTRGFDRAVNVLGADHHGYVPRLKSALLALGVDAGKLDTVLIQMVRLVREGEVVKLSKRSGKAITLTTLLDDVPVDAARFHFNLREPNSQFDFDLDLAVEQSSQNPVYYVQYAHARICSIDGKAGEAGFDHGEASLAELDLLAEPEETALIRQLARFPEEVAQSAKGYDPARVTRFCIELATLFHKFYNSHKVISEDAGLSKARITLCHAVRTVLANGLALLKIDAPAKM